MPLTESGKEKIKARAAFVSDIGTAIFTAGVLTPIITLALSNTILSGVMVLAVLVALVCFALTFILYLHAEGRLSELDE